MFRILLLVAAATLLPLVWGWAMYWLMVRLWPTPGEPVPASEPGQRGDGPVWDYQI